VITTLRERGAIAITLLIIACIHIALLLKNIPTTYRYDELARAFLHSQTHRIDGPAPALLALKDPRDATANEAWREHDLVLFDGKYYFYWGPAPALLITPIVAICGTVRISDAWIAWAFAQLTLVAIAMTLAVTRRRWFPQSGVVPILFGILAVGLATPFPFLFARPGIYEAAILGGQCFAMLATFHAVRMLSQENRSPWRLFVVGVFAALACASRLNLAPALTLFALALLWDLQRRDGASSWKRLAVRGAIVGVPMLVVALALAAYNDARFGSFRETGIQYMLASRPGRTALSRGQAFSSRYIAANAANFLGAPISFESTPPFAFPTRGIALPRPPRYYRTDIVAGIVTAAPVFLLALIPIVLGAWHGIRAGSTAITFTLLLTATAALILPILMFFYCSIRYLADFTPAMGLLAGVALFQVRSKRAWSLAVGLLLVSCAVGVALAITGYSATAAH
jgi:hypothetical protein